MTLRVALSVLLLAGGLVGQIVFSRHFESSGPPEPGKLNMPIAELPLQFEDWIGKDRPIENESYLYGDEHLQRYYVHQRRRQSLSMWMVFSKDGSDRGHHPEVCMSVAGHAEDTSGRGTLNVDEGAPIQQYRFSQQGKSQWVFYWYYTLPFESDRSLDEAQRLYRDLKFRPASITIEVFAPDTNDGDAEHARDFVTALDQAVQKHLRPGTKRGSQRLPVTVVNR